MAKALFNYLVALAANAGFLSAFYLVADAGWFFTFWADKGGFANWEWSGELDHLTLFGLALGAEVFLDLVHSINHDLIHASKNLDNLTGLTLVFTA